MTKRFPLGDGRVVDLEHEWPPDWFHPEVVYSHRFDDGATPWWLTEEAEGAGGGVTYGGLSAAAGLGTATLSTGADAIGNATNLATPAINFDNWEEVWFGAWYSAGPMIQSPNASFIQLSWGDAPATQDLLNGVYWQGQTGNQAIDLRVENGDVVQYDNARGAGRESQMLGFRFWENPGHASTVGHSVIAYSDWEPAEKLTENAHNIPLGEHPLRIGAVTDDGADHTAIIDRVVLALG